MHDIYDVLRRIIREEVVNLFGMDDDEGDECEDCPAIGPIMAILEGQREEIAELKRQIANRPIITAEPIQTTAFDHIYRPWNITYTRP